MMNTPHTMVLQDTYLLTKSVRHFVLALQEQVPWTFVPGQFVTIHFPHGDKMLRRSYSIATVPGQTTHVEFAASFVPEGPGSEYLFELKKGDTVTVSGPFGRLIIPPDVPLDQKIFLISTGTGVTPYRSMLPQLSKLSNECHILQGVPHQEDALYTQDFLHHCQCFSHMHYYLCLSRAQQMSMPYEFQGYVQHQLQKLSPDPCHDLILLCGNPNMIDAAFSDLTSQGFPSQRIRREKYISPKK